MSHNASTQTRESKCRSLHTKKIILIVKDTLGGDSCIKTSETPKCSVFSRQAHTEYVEKQSFQKCSVALRDAAAADRLYASINEVYAGLTGVNVKCKLNVT